MRLYTPDPSLRDAWKRFPLRVRGPRLSSCHQRPTVLVQSMEGGFVTQNCSECGRKDTVGAREFEQLDLWVACPDCGRRMEPRVLEKNYDYVCRPCDLRMDLAVLLPPWKEV